MNEDAKALLAIADNLEFTFTDSELELIKRVADRLWRLEARVEALNDLQRWDVELPDPLTCPAPQYATTEDGCFIKWDEVQYVLNDFASAGEIR